MCIEEGALRGPKPSGAVVQHHDPPPKQAFQHATQYNTSRALYPCPEAQKYGQSSSGIVANTLKALIRRESIRIVSDFWRFTFSLVCFASPRHKGNKGGAPSKACIHEEMLPPFLDLVIWGHEHDCEARRGPPRVSPPPSAFPLAVLAARRASPPLWTRERRRGGEPPGEPPRRVLRGAARVRGAAKQTFTPT